MKYYLSLILGAFSFLIMTSEANAQNLSIECPSDTSVVTGATCEYIMANYFPLITVNDADGAVTFTQAPETGTGLGEGTHTVEITVEDESGATSSCTFEIEVELITDEAKVKDSPLYICNEDDVGVNISAETPLAGIGNWSSTSGVVNFLDASMVNTVASNFEDGWNELVWTLEGGACETTTDTLFVFKKETAIIYTADTTVCITSGEFTINAKEYSEDSDVVWYSSTGSIDTDDDGSSVLVLNKVDAGENVIIYVVNHPVCGTSTAEVVVFGDQCGEFNPLIPTMITPNGDGKNDLFVIENLHALYPEAEVTIVNRWGNPVYESTGYEEPWDGTYMNEGNELPMGAYFYRIVLNDSDNKEITGPISIIR